MRLLNCLTFALSRWRYDGNVYLSMRKSLHGWFPHFRVSWENGDVLVVKEYVPDNPVRRRIPPLWFKGRIRVTVWRKAGESHE